MLLGIVLILASEGWAQSAGAPASESLIPLPAPTGNEAVGTTTTFWVDSARADTIDATPRTVSAQIWYPAEVAAGSAVAGYAAGVDTAGDYGRLLASVRGHARRSPRFARKVKRAPVLLFSTGRSLSAYDYTSMAEDLASHGYVVVGVNSPGLSRYWRPDGVQVPAQRPPSIRVLQKFDSADVVLEPMIRDVSADLRFALGRLEQADRSDPILKDHLDLKRIAMAGHSNGAIAASRACAGDERCRAYFGIEGTQAREVRKGGVTKPFALLISDQSLGFDAENVYRELGTHSASRYTVIVVKGAGHNTFTDLLLVRPSLFQYSIDPKRGAEITRVAVRAFLDTNLRDKDPGLLKSALAPYSEVDVQTAFTTGSGQPSKP
ncbi:MAG TPA: hypothetical protein VFX78_15260 [Candidatus Eisenbacteria bacterium]|nr:hypothetical protein [Candidatus Eisenbacteria bacterium]